MNSRREFIARGCQLAAVAALPVSALAALPEVAEAHACSARRSLTGVWQFQLDPDRTGETKLWHKPTAGPDWLAAEVPHTWQIRKDSADYFGSAWYHRAFQVPREWKERSRCAWYSMFSVPRDFRLSRRVGHLKSARKILENQIRS